MGYLRRIACGEVGPQVWQGLAMCLRHMEEEQARATQALAQAARQPAAAGAAVIMGRLRDVFGWVTGLHREMMLAAAIAAGVPALR